MTQHDELIPGPVPTAVVWDLDGTLIDSAPDIAVALNTLLNEHDQHGHPVEKVRPMIGAGVAKLIERGFRAAGAPLDDAACGRLVPRFVELYSAHATDQTRLVTGAREALSHVYDAGARQAICTNKPLDLTVQILNALDIAGFFAAVVGGDSTPEKKPHPLPLLTCLEELGAAPGDALMIGDSAADVGSARAAGVPVILVPDGYTGVPAASLGADYVVGSLAEIPACFVPGAPVRRSA
jgi:phosphoglycolate phosphatase